MVPVSHGIDVSVALETSLVCNSGNYGEYLDYQEYICINQQSPAFDLFLRFKNCGLQIEDYRSHQTLFLRDHLITKFKEVLAFLNVRSYTLCIECSRQVFSRTITHSPCNLCFAFPWWPFSLCDCSLLIDDVVFVIKLFH